MSFHQFFSHFFLLTLVSLFPSSCHLESEYDNPKICKIDLTDVQRFSFFEYLENPEYIKLENNEEHPIGNIKKLLFFNEYFIILDNLTNIIHCIDQSGKTRFIIDKTGKGPGEYVQASDIFLASHEKSIVVFDQMGMALYYYSIENGTFIKKIDMDFLPVSIVSIKKGILAAFMSYTSHPQESTKDYPHNLVVFRNPKKIIQAYLPFDSDVILPCYSPNIFTHDKGKTFCVPTFQNSVYEFDNNSCHEIIKLDFGKYNFSTNLFENLNSSQERFNKLYHSKVVFGISNFYELNNQFHISFEWKGMYYTIMIDKDSFEPSVYTGWKNNLNGLPVGQFITCSDNCMYFKLEPTDILNQKNYFIKKEHSTSRIPLLIDSLFPNLISTDNPIIAKFNLKK